MWVLYLFMLLLMFAISTPVCRLILILHVQPVADAASGHRSPFEPLLAPGHLKTATSGATALSHAASGSSSALSGGLTTAGSHHIGDHHHHQNHVHAVQEDDEDSNCKRMKVRNRGVIQDVLWMLKIKTFQAIVLQVWHRVLFLVLAH